VDNGRGSHQCITVKSENLPTLPGSPERLYYMSFLKGRLAQYSASIKNIKYMTVLNDYLFTSRICTDAAFVNFVVDKKEARICGL